MVKFDPTDPERLVQKMLGHLHAIAVAKNERDCLKEWDTVQDDEWLRRLGLMRIPFIEMAGAAGLGKPNAIAVWKKLWEAALQIRRDAGDLVTVFTACGIRKIDAETRGLVLDERGRWMHSWTMNRKLLDSVSVQCLEATNAVGELSSVMRPNPNNAGSHKSDAREKAKQEYFKLRKDPASAGKNASELAAAMAKYVKKNDGKLYKPASLKVSISRDWEPEFISTINSAKK